jgi:hypothetical protein
MEAYNSKKQRMFLESQSRKWHIDFAYTILVYVLLILVYVMYRYIQMYLLMFLFDHYGILVLCPTF